MPGLRAEAGSRPGGRGTFLCFAKEKYPKERRPPVCDPFAERRGKPAACRLRGAPWNSLCAARAARTATASQFTRHGRFDAHAHPATAPPQAQPAGVGSQTSNSRTATRAIAALGPDCAARGACARETGPSAAQRSNGPCGCPLPGFPSGCAWGAQGAGWHVCRRTHMLRELTHRSCSSEAPQARSEFCGAPRDRAPQVAP